MIRKLLIANRGEIAIRIARSARELGIDPVMIHSKDDGASAHVRHGSASHPLRGSGPAAYLDAGQILGAARANGCDAIHPGYGFLSENAGFASRCAETGLTFVGPRAELIALFGEKIRARELAKSCGVPVIEATPDAADERGLRAFLEAQGQGGAIMLKAVSGGGGRGMRLVERAEDLAEAEARCRSEALRAFGSEALYAERYIRHARHIEVQIAGDGAEIIHLGERDCTLQRQNQKIVEIAPAPALDPALRDRLHDAALRMARACGYDNIGTFEFLIDLDRAGQPDEFVFIEANPRLQVEHTVTEEVLGLDIVRVQLELASGHSLAALGLDQNAIGAPRGYAMQLRINMETMDRTGQAHPGAGRIARFDLPGGPGIRIDTFGHAGYETSARFDSLLAKLIVHSPTPGFAAVAARARRALGEIAIEGVPTNLPFLRALLDHPRLATYDLNTRFIADHAPELVPEMSAGDAPPEQGGGGDGWITIRAPMTGVIAGLSVMTGDRIARGTEVAVIEAMKLEHGIRADAAGVVREILSRAGDHVPEGAAILRIEPADVETSAGTGVAGPDPDSIRPDLAELHERIAETLDENRPEAVARRRGRSQRTARENIADLCDEGSFIEYGQLTVAYMHARRTMADLRARTSADGYVTGLATVNAAEFGPERTAIAVGAYDATVIAGTQGHMNHKKTDRLLRLAGERGLPFVLFAEGGGGRPREDPVTIAGLHSHTFRELANLSGKVPLVGIVSGYCFAGNAALLGLTDTIIATENSSIGMAGPALIEAAGLGACAPESVGPIDLQCRSGVADIRVSDEAEAVAVTKRYLGYFQGRLTQWEAADPRLLRHAIPESRLRAYDVRDVIALIADRDSWLELRRDFGRSYVIGLLRIEGRPLGVIANNPLANAGAIDSDGADKAARFLRLCDAHGLPVLSLIDTPGIMVGTEAEATGLVRHSARLFAAAASMRVPIFAVVLRKAYGLGGAAAAGGNFHAPFFTIGWPSAELGGMGLEGSVNLAYKRELEAIRDPAERQAFFEKRVAARYEKGKATYAATYFELDAVIDPADTRSWLVRGLESAGETPCGQGRFIDTW